MTTVSEPAVKVAPCSSVVRMVSCGSSRHISASGAPVSSVAAMCAINPVIWNNGATPRMTSSLSSSTHSRYVCALKTTLRCVVMDPLYGTVVLDGNDDNGIVFGSQATAGG